MEKKDLVSGKMERFVSERAINALMDGKGSRAIGTDGGIEVGSTFTLLSVDFTGNWFAPEGSDLKASELREMSEEELKAAGCHFNEWFSFDTNNGPLSFSAVIGDTAMYRPEFWDGVEDKSDDFDVTKIFRPSCRAPKAWIKADVDGLIGKTLRCVAVKSYKRGDFDAKARAFVVMDQDSFRESLGSLYTILLCIVLCIVQIQHIYKYARVFKKVL